jgi:hypothetical protein
MQLIQSGFSEGQSAHPSLESIRDFYINHNQNRVSLLLGMPEGKSLKRGPTLDYHDISNYFSKQWKHISDRHYDSKPKPNICLDSYFALNIMVNAKPLCRQANDQQMSGLRIFVKKLGKFYFYICLCYTLI